MKKMILIFIALNLSLLIIGDDLTPIYITPYYDSQPLTIDVGEYSKKLLTKNVSELYKTIAEIKKNIDNVNIETLYILSIRLYDLKEKDEAVYWFYFAQLRARVFLSMLDKSKIGSLGSEAFELKQAINSFNQLIGIYINGYGFGDIDKIEQTFARVINENKIPVNFLKVYKNINFNPEISFEKIYEEQIKGLNEFIAYVEENKEDIRVQRKLNGIDGKY